MLTCNRCRRSKEEIYFHRDRTSVRGFASACIECRKLPASHFKRTNEEKMEIEVIKEFMKPKNIVTPEIKHCNPPVKIEVEPEVDNEAIHKGLDELYKPDDIFTQLSNKFGCHYSISISRKGAATLTSHGSPQTTWKAESAQKVIDMVLS